MTEEWTACDDSCTHGGEVRVWYFGTEELEGPDHNQDGLLRREPEGYWKIIPDLDPRAWMGYKGRATFRMQARSHD